MIITLIGFRGSGKSSVGPLLAQRLDMSFIDTDQQIEKKMEKSISEIFAEQGEEYFRKIEVETIQALYRKDQQVVATGGGAVLNPQTEQLIKISGPVVWLRADTETTLQRIQNDHATGTVRPALTDLDFEQEVATLLKQREPIYRNASTISVDTVDATPEQIVEKIVQSVDLSDWGSS